MRDAFLSSERLSDPPYEFVVGTPRHQAYHTTIVFLIPAVMLLPPELVALIGVIQHVPEWLKNRNAWYSQIFNICNW